MPKKKIKNKESFIVVKGARVNNLKNVDVTLPHNKLVVFTGLSGSGKTSLVFDTIYAEGQRRYIESLSSYARQFLEKINKPDVDSISGLAPSMAIERKTQARNPRSTVGTTTEIYDYLRLLFARAGKTYSPVSGKEVRRDTIEDVIKFIHSFKDGTRIYIIFPVHKHESRRPEEEIEVLRQKGFFRIFDGYNIIDLNKFEKEEIENSALNVSGIKVIADRFIYKSGDEELESRMTDSIESAFNEGDGYLSVLVENKESDNRFREYRFNSHLELDDIRFEDPEPELFSFNNPVGACPKCQGFGETIDLDTNLIVPDKTKTLFENAVHPFSTPKHSRHLSDLIKVSGKYSIRIHEPYINLTQKELEHVWNGAGEFIGIKKFFRMVEREAAYKIHYRVLMSRYRAFTTCSECGGSRLRKEALYVKFRDKTIKDIVNSNIETLYKFFRVIKLDERDLEISGRLVEEITSRLTYLYEVGLGYLTLNRLSNTLSGGETQRINLSTTLGSSLVGSIYVLDEPSIGLHPRDNDRLINILKSLRDIGNSVLVVEHDPEMMYSSDYIVDVGPKAGEEGGEIMYSGSVKGIESCSSLTGKYLSGKMRIELPYKRRPLNNHFLKIKGASENNLKNIDVEIPLGLFVCITGVSGSGKSTLISDILYGALKKKLEGIYNERIGHHISLAGQQYLGAVELVDQSPIGKTPRSNPVTYLKIFDLIRDLYGNLPGSKLKGYSPGSFSFNIPGGRCETCEGSGVIKIAMQFMADIYLECDVCKGKRYKSDILEIEYNGLNISSILQLTVTEAIQFFKGLPRIVTKLRILEEVGLGYLRLGQSATTLSGGEAQRIKLAYHLTFQESGKKTLFIFDEPTTGLHLHDISKLLKSFNKLIEKGNSVIIVEHNLEVIKCADYIIDLGPDSGDKGGYIVASGTPEVVAKSSGSYTGKYLSKLLSKQD